MAPKCFQFDNVGTTVLFVFFSSSVLLWPKCFIFPLSFPLKDSVTFSYLVLKFFIKISLEITLFLRFSDLIDSLLNCGHGVFHHISHYVTPGLKQQKSSNRFSSTDVHKSFLQVSCISEAGPGLVNKGFLIILFHAMQFDLLHCYWSGV